MERVSLNTSLMAAEIAALLTRMTPSSRERHRRNVSAPTVLTATPSAKASTRDRVTRRPAARDWAIALAPAGSTPITRTSGRRALM